MFREPKGTKVFDTDRFAAAPTDADEVRMDVQKDSDAKDTSGPLSSVNPPISVTAPKPLSSYMDSISVLPTKETSFAYSNVYSTISLNTPAQVGGRIKSKAVTLLLSCEGSSLKIVSFSFGSPVSASDVSKPRQEQDLYTYVVWIRQTCCIL